MDTTVTRLDVSSNSAHAATPGTAPRLVSVLAGGGVDSGTSARRGNDLGAYTSNAD